MECKSSALCLFDEQDVQTDILGTTGVDYHPVSTLTSGAPIEFFIPGSSDEYIDMHKINMLCRVKITQNNGKDIAAADKVAFVNLPLSSLFEDAFLTIGDTQVEGGQHCYPYNGYISSLLQFHPSAKKTHMQCWGWDGDEPNKFNDEGNKGYKFRKQNTDLSKEWEIYGPIFFDMCRQPRYLLPHTDVRMKFLPSKAAFCLQSFISTSKDYRVKITKCILHVPRIRVNDSVISGHNLGLEKNNAKYLLRHTDVSTFTIASGISSFIKDRLFMSQAPRLLVVGLTEHNAFNGDMEKSPFNFENFDLSKVSLTRDGEVVSGLSFTPNYGKDHFKHAYASAQSALGYFNSDDSNGLTLEHFKYGYNLYCFDLTPDANSDAPYRSPTNFSSLRLELGFRKVLTKTINVVLFGVFDSKLEITKLRDVITNYNR